MKLIDANKLIEKLSANLDNPEEFPVISLGTVMRMIDGEEEIHISEPEAPCYLGSPCEYQNPNAEIQEERTDKHTETRACVLIRQQDAVELAMKYCPDDDGTVQCDGDIRELLDELENLPPAQPESEHTMEEFMYGQDVGSPEDGSL